MFRKFAFLAFAIAVLSGAFGLASAEAEEKLRGIVLVNVDSKTGRVTSARMLQSTGVQVVDAALLEQFRKWRFRPGTPPKVRIPVTFSLRGELPSSSRPNPFDMTGFGLRR
jgi:TonB family protein